MHAQQGTTVDISVRQRYSNLQDCYEDFSKHSRPRSSLRPRGRQGAGHILHFLACDVFATAMMFVCLGRARIVIIRCMLARI